MADLRAMPPGLGGKTPVQCLWKFGWRPPGSSGTPWWTRDKGHSMTREQGERCGKTYQDAAFSMNDQFRCELPENDGFAAREFVARVFLPGASSMPANALGAFHEAVGERLSSDAPVVDADGVFDK